MTLIVHISDTHFGTEVPPVLEALRRAIAQLEPDIILLTGNITQRALTVEFSAAANFFTALPAKTKLAVPGNHDIPLFNLMERFTTPYRKYVEAFGPRLQFWVQPGLGIVCLDATNPLRHTKGRLKLRSMMQLFGTMNTRIGEDALRIVCAHQPLYTAWPQDAHETLLNRDEVAQFWSAARVDIALSGHVHVPLLATTEHVFPGLPHHFILAGAGTAVSHRVRPGAPNSFNVICLEGQNSVYIACHSYNTDKGEFTAPGATYFRRDAKGWQQL